MELCRANVLVASITSTGQKCPPEKRENHAGAEARHGGQARRYVKISSKSARLKSKAAATKSACRAEDRGPTFRSNAHRRFPRAREFKSPARR